MALTNYQEENAKAEQIGAGIAVGCGAIILIVVAIVLIAALVS